MSDDRELWAHPDQPGLDPSDAAVRLGTVYPASKEAVDFVLAQEAGIGRGVFCWIVLANGDLALAVFPQNDAYEEILNGRFAKELR